MQETIENIDSGFDFSDSAVPSAKKVGKYTVSRHEFWNIWYIHTKGKTPRDLEGGYTSVKEAEKAIERYMNAKAS